MKKRIFVSGPYTLPDCAVNVRNAILATGSLMDVGFLPYCPHLSHFVHLLLPHSYEQWMALDLAWLESCDAVLRLPGESPGADRETARARELGIPVFHSFETLCEWAYP